LRFVPLAAVLLFAGLACCWRSWLQLRRHGGWGILLFRSRSWPQNLRDASLLLVLLLLLGQALLAAARPEMVSQRFVLQAAGSVLLFGGIALLVTAQLHLGASWRVGIDERARPGLVTAGLYRFCRNPIFLALLITICGYALLLPTWLSAALLIGTFIGVREQVRAEEAYLLAAYGESYRDYAGRVGRFLPGLGRLSR
jgi:protein-S-isoprenylcysteine O-methyltransferase Ste14